MSLTTPISVQKLQTALHAKAKESLDFRFYALYDKVYRKDVLAHAYERCQANGGAAGVDNQTFENIEAYGRERWLDELTQELKSRTYQPLPVRRVYIPKPDGKQRPLGIPPGDYSYCACSRLYSIVNNISNDVGAVKILGTLFLELRGITSPQRASTGLFETVAMFLSVMLYPTA